MISTPDRREAIELIEEARESGSRIIPACKALDISVRTYERWRSEEGEGVKEDGRPGSQRPKPPNSLSAEEEKKILSVCNSPEYASKPPSQIVPDLADKGIYIASESTFYRVLRKSKQLRHRSRSRAPMSKVPETHTATGPNQVWTWDITYLPGSIKGNYYKLYMILDIYSRKIVGWEVWGEERAEYAERLIRQTVIREKARSPLVLHSDNGSPMKAATFLATLAKLGITPSHSRPRVSNDNPYSEASFRTMKYRPEYPVGGFRDIATAREWVRRFTDWYHHEHRHSGIGYITPWQRHVGEGAAIHAKRRSVYEAAQRKHPNRWSRQIRKWQSPTAVSLNPDRKSSSGRPKGKRKKAEKSQVMKS
jgi:putative transposase